ncbi:PREDICTED: ribonuclease H2 subunit C [Nanorana parkeri]|uniref:ribonuclease H2 subunit C n=1 Tax=Nanorana parkeri TaxID=125878 RepID=UPI00085431F9|nr:PREDICTED: ribonuclease H2 subunit C [Nanorana parkeri]
MTESRPASCARLELGTLTSADQEPLHLLPCVIQRHGAARVNAFFTPAIRNASGGKEVSFRGRIFRGQEVTVPEGYMGLVLKEDNKPFSEEEDRSLTVRNTFQSFTQWNLETPPSADDVLVMSLAWPKIAAAVHAPVD